MQTYTDNRQETELRKQFNKAYRDLALLLPCYRSEARFEVIEGYLKAFALLKGNDTVKGRLINRLSWVI